jgi:hypothetical protein
MNRLKNLKPAAMTIINKEEVVRLTELETGFFDRLSIRNIKLVEAQLKTTCIGPDLYGALVAALTDFSGALQYSSGTTYTIGETVFYNGVYREATKSTTLEPSHDFAWKDAEKFNDAALNELWNEKGLGEVFAYAVLADSLPLIKTKTRNAGLVNNFSSGEQRAVQYDIRDAEDYIINTAGRWIDVFVANYKTAGLPYSVPCVDNYEQCTCNSACASGEATNLERIFYGGFDYIGQTNTLCRACKRKMYNSGHYGVY